MCPCDLSPSGMSDVCNKQQRKIRVIILYFSRIVAFFPWRPVPSHVWILD